MESNEGLERGLLRVNMSLWSEPLGDVAVLPCDRYIASSLMQKAIRKREEHSALAAALTLFRLDRKQFWRRLHLISLEDCGVSASEEILSVLSVLSDPIWRKRTGEEQVALCLVRLLCRSTKLRLADHLFSIAVKDTNYSLQREQFAWKSHTELADLALDKSLSLPERSLALWYLAGTKRYPCDQLAEKAGSLEVAADVMRQLAPHDFSGACISALRRSEYPLALWSPLIWSEVQERAGIIDRKFNSIPLADHVEGLPTYAFDMFTRSGSAAVQQFRSRVPDLKEFSSRQIGLAIFFLEGSTVDCELTSPVLDHYKQQGELADALASGLHPSTYLGMKGCVSTNLGLLQQIRLKSMMDYNLKWREEELFGSRRQ